MRYLLLNVLLLFSVSLFAADGIMPDDWDIAAVKLVSVDTTDVPLIPERPPSVAGGDHATVGGGTKAIAATKLICYRVRIDPPVMTVQLPWEVGWQY